MIGYLLDTNHASQLYGPPNAILVRYRNAAANGAKFHVCPVALSETRFGILTGKHRAVMSADWDRVLIALEKLPLDRQDAEFAARLRAAQRSIGRQFKLGDSLIAAVAIRYDLTLLTADRDFDRIPGLRVENWLDP